MAGSISSSSKRDAGDIGVACDALPPFDEGPIDVRVWFGERRDRPLELEIGSGKGTFLVQQAAACPDINYIGIEYARAYWLHAADRCRRHGLTNVRMAHTEAGLFVRNYLPPATLRQAHIYFPDPWPKKRHHKRRLIQAPFLRQLHRVLEDVSDDGAPMVRIATDHEDYFAWMVEHVAAVDDLFERLPFESPQAAGVGELVGTNFERKYRREGRGFHAMVLRKLRAG